MLVNTRRLMRLAAPSRGVLQNRIAWGITIPVLRSYRVTG